MNSHVYKIVILAALFLHSCSQPEGIENVDVEVSGASVLFVSGQDTISKFVNPVSTQSVIDKRHYFYPNEELSTLKRTWSCNLYYDKGRVPIFDFRGMENALNTVFHRFKLKGGDEDIATRFILERLFVGSYLISDNNSDWKKCEYNYQEQLYLVLNDTLQSDLYIRNLDVCQIRQTLDANLLVLSKYNEEVFFSLLDCPSLNEGVGFIINKPYFRLQYTSQNSLEVKFELLNDLSYFGWIDI